MPTMQEVRQKYPQYNDLSDEQLADALHRKFYSDMPKEEFAAKIGLTDPSKRVGVGTVPLSQEEYARRVEEGKSGSMTGDILRSGATGLREGVESGIGMFGDAARTSGDVAAWLAGKLGIGEGGQDIARGAFRLANPGAMMPSTEDVRRLTDPAVRATGAEDVLAHEPQSVAGEYARTVGQFAPAALGPGSAARRVANVAVPALMSETAGQATKGTDLEPYARTAAAIVGGGLTAGRNVKGPKVPTPTAEDIKAGGSAAYKAAGMDAVQVRPAAVKKALVNTALKMRSFGHDRDLQPDTTVVLKRFFDLSKNPNPTFMEFENLRKKAVAVAREAQRPSDRSAAGIIIDQIDNAMDDAASFVAGGKNAVAAVKTAREAWKRGKKTEIIELAVEKAQNQATGFENGLVIQFRSIANNPKKMRQFTKQEQALIKSVVRRPSVHGLLRAVGMLAPNSTFGGMVAGAGIVSGVIPGLATAGAGALSRAAAGKLTRAKVGKLQNAVATGKLPPRPTRDPEALARFLLTSKVGQNSALQHAPLVPIVR
jgi:hypothetical protein